MTTSGFRSGSGSAALRISSTCCSVNAGAFFSQLEP